MKSERMRHAGVFVEFSAIIGIHGWLNMELIQRLREIAKTRPVTVISEVGSEVVHGLLKQNGLDEFPFKSNYDLRGMALEEVISDRDEAEFRRSDIEPEKFTTVDPWRSFRPVIISFVGPDDETHIGVKVARASTKEAISEELKRAGLSKEFTVVDGMDEGEFPEEIRVFFEKFARVWKKLGRDDCLAIERVMTVLMQRVEHLSALAGIELVARIGT